ncbi:MAG: hypothetical protein RLN75_04110, partial [Longimicrobiales bacterium]
RLKTFDEGWTLAVFAPDDTPPAAEHERWIDESFMLLAPRRVLRRLDDGAGGDLSRARAR